MTPALFMSTSSRGACSAMAAAASRTDDRSARSRATTSGSGPVATAATSARAVSAFSALRAAISTRAPARARAVADSSPSPLVAPVTTMVRPSCEGMSATVHVAFMGSSAPMSPKWRSDPAASRRI